MDDFFLFPTYASSSFCFRFLSISSRLAPLPTLSGRSLESSLPPPPGSPCPGPPLYLALWPGGRQGAVSRESANPIRTRPDTLERKRRERERESAIKQLSSVASHSPPCASVRAAQEWASSTFEPRLTQGILCGLRGAVRKSHLTPLSSAAAPLGTWPARGAHFKRPRPRQPSCSGGQRANERPAKPMVNAGTARAQQVSLLALFYASLNPHLCLSLSTSSSFFFFLFFLAFHHHIHLSLQACTRRLYLEL